MLARNKNAVDLKRDVQKLCKRQELTVGVFVSRRIVLMACHLSSVLACKESKSFTKNFDAWSFVKRRTASQRSSNLFEYQNHACHREVVALYEVIELQDLPRAVQLMCAKFWSCGKTKKKGGRKELPIAKAGGKLTCGCLQASRQSISSIVLSSKFKICVARAIHSLRRTKPSGTLIAEYK